MYVTDILTDPIWEHYRNRMLPYGIRSVWSHPLFTSEGKALGTFSINYREPHRPSANELQLIENATLPSCVGCTDGAPLGLYEVSFSFLIHK